MFFPWEHLHTNCPGPHMDIKRKLSSSTRLRVWSSWNPSLLNPLYSLARVWKQTNKKLNKNKKTLISYSHPPLSASSRRVFSSLLGTSQEKSILYFHTSTCTVHLSHNVWYPSAEEEEGNDATELEGACTSQHKSSHSCINNSVYVSRSLFMNSPQHKSVTSRSLRRYLSDLGISHQKSLGVSKVLPKGQGVDTQNVQTCCDLNNLIKFAHDPKAE